MMSGLSVVVVGDSKCGKTQLINRFANGAFDQVSDGLSTVSKLAIIFLLVITVM